MIHKTYLLVPKTIDEKNRTLTAVISNEDLDRQGDVVVQSGIDTTNFDLNPVVLDEHNVDGYGNQVARDPVGRVVKLIKNDTSTEAVVQFTTEEENPAGHRIWLQFKNGFRRAFSVGIGVIESEEREIDGKIVRYITKSELVELSVSVVGANPKALAKAYYKGHKYKQMTGEIASIDKKNTSNGIMAGMEDQIKTLIDAVKAIDGKLDTQATAQAEGFKALDAKFDALNKSNEPEEDEKAEEAKAQAEREAAEAEGYEKGLNEDDDTTDENKAPEAKETE